MFNTICKVFVITIIFITTLLLESLSVSSKSNTCEPKNCGNGPNISNPFWISQLQESYCGSPGFDITCNTNNNPVLTISNDDYIVKDIFYSNNSILLANSQVFYGNNTCPTPTHNFSTDGTPFTYSDSSADLFFFYNCTFNYELNKPFVDCASHATYHSFAVFHKESVEERYYSVGSCQRLVNAPVTIGDLDVLLRMNYTDFLRNGFLLQWRGVECNGCKKNGKDPNIPLKVGIGVGAALFGIIGSINCFIIYLCCRKSSMSESLAFWKSGSKNDKYIEALIIQYRFSAPKRYKYSEIKRMTNSFKDELGRGGFGSVFKGMLADGSFVAVKVLNESKGSGEEFINEVASIGKTSHVNIVALLGFCYEGKKRALVFEFMCNGSLEKFIYQNIPTEGAQLLRLEKLYEIAVGIARGLEYLHRWCSTRILHFDIKPHNILLDEDFCPKISDFGLAKLYSRKESIVSMVEARGTIGYIAPEVYNRNFGGVSHKSDVYSYGMMILEMVGGRKNIDVQVIHSSEIYFPQWIYKHLELDEDLIRLQQRPATMVEKEIARKMIVVGLWCIQANPSQRPSMNKVIEMLQGSMEALDIPPNPFFSSPPPSVPMTSSTTLERISLE